MDTAGIVKKKCMHKSQLPFSKKRFSFRYFNDDMFIVAPSNAEDFFFESVSQNGTVSVGIVVCVTPFSMFSFLGKLMI